MSNRRRARGINLPALTTAAAGPSLILASPTSPIVDFEARTISGVAVPFGRPGETSGGRLRFAAGAIAISGAKRVKLLVEHEQKSSVGYGLTFEELPAEEIDARLAAAGLEPLGVDGMWASFHVPDGPAGDVALAEAANGVRDAFSVGVQLDDASLLNARRAKPGTVVDAAGQLREVSLVSVPAFDDARVGAVAAAELIVSAWTTPTTSAAGTGTTRQEGNTPMKFTDEQRRRLAQLLAQSSHTATEATERDLLSQLAAAAGVTVTPEAAAPEGEQTTDQPTAQQTAAASAGGLVTGAPATAQAGLTRPAVIPAVAGAAYVTAEASPYTFGSDGASLVRDLWDSQMKNDSAAAERVAKFNAQLTDGNAPTLHAFVTAAATRGDVDGAGTDLAPSWGGQNTNRPDLMKSLIDVRRPFISRLGTIPISNAQPFAIPKVGEFAGVADHVEGENHRPAGTFSLSGDVVQPVAVSGAWEASRELLDAANPALDRVAIRAMLRDYARKSEGKIITLLNAFAATEANNVYDVATTIALRGALLGFVNDDEEPADLLAVSKGLLVTLGLDVDDVNRPQLPFVTPTNSVGSLKAGGTGFNIDGVEAFRSARLDGGSNLGSGSGVMARGESILWCESPVAQFRFDEVLGPGVVKLALWAYNGTALLDTSDVKILKAGADPTP